jgi:hypothetical protein
VRLTLATDIEVLTVRLKSHFTSLISTISFTLYALLPTLHPQISAEYPVETISQALQGLSAPASSAAESTDPTPDSSVVLQPPDPNAHGDAGTHGVQGGVEQSWTSDFKTESVAESEQPSLVGDSVLHGHEYDVVRLCLENRPALMHRNPRRCPSPFRFHRPTPPRSPLRRRPSNLNSILPLLVSISDRRNLILPQRARARKSCGGI